jgi:hypothetical protein
MGDMQYEIQKQQEEELMVAVNQTISYEVDKEELIKALQYDREQYDKGYSDCKSDMLAKVKETKKEISEWDVNKVMDGCSEPFRLGVTKGLDIASVILDSLIAESEE